MMRLYRSLIILFCLAIDLVTNSALASNLSISPIKLSLSPQQRITTLTLANDSDKLETIDITPKLWLQENAKDTYKPTSNIIITPPIVTILPHSQQVIRIGLADHKFLDNEVAYRVYLTEILLKKDSHNKEIRIGLNIALPLFVAPITPAQQKITWQAKLNNNRLYLTLDNEGNQHLKVQQLELYTLNQTQPFSVETNSKYILAKHKYTWVLPIDKKQIHNNIKIRALMGDGNVETTIPITS